MSFSASLVFRPMTRSDLDRVLLVEADCYPHPWTGEMFVAELDAPHGRIELCVDGEELAGFMVCWYLLGELHVLNVATAPRYRRRGIAAALLRRAFDRARTEGLEKAFLEVRKGNAGAIALYRRFGFEDVAVRPRYYSDGEDALIMEWTPL